MSDPKLIRVLIVDDHAVVRGGLSKFLQMHKDIELVGEAENGAEAVRLTRQLQPDVVLMDLKMPEMDGVYATREIRTKHPNVRVLVLTSFADDNMVQGALQAGATGYLLKNVSGAELANAIRAANAGRMTLSSEATEVLVHAATHPLAPVDELTEREREVLALMVDGLSNQEIADRLFLSLGTVKFHAGNIYSKLGVESRVAAVTLAIQRRLV
jgi:NarL family two-component system response regulator LiaR